MSGLVGIFNFDGAPVDLALLERLTSSLAFRGPDAQRTWARGPVGFGHALLRTSKESKNEKQTLALDGDLCIVADARVDARRELIATLHSHGLQALDALPDAQLILHAYRVWDENCVDHLIGDFAFAIWDERRRRLFCSRDHFGMKPFFLRGHRQFPDFQQYTGLSAPASRDIRPVERLGRRRFLNVRQQSGLEHHGFRRYPALAPSSHAAMQK